MKPSEVKAPREREEPVVNSIREFIRQCPYIREFAKTVNMNYLNPDVKSYMIETVPADPIVKKYVNGNTIRQIVFNMASRETFTQDVLENCSKSGFYERFAGWLEECTRQQVLPTLGTNQTPISIEATTNGYVMSADNGKAQYIIQCNFKYLETR